MTYNFDLMKTTLSERSGKKHRERNVGEEALGKKRRDTDIAGRNVGVSTKVERNVGRTKKTSELQQVSQQDVLFVFLALVFKKRLRDLQEAHIGLKATLAASPEAMMVPIPRPSLILIVEGWRRPLGPRRPGLPPTGAVSKACDHPASQSNETSEKTSSPFSGGSASLARVDLFLGITPAPCRARHHVGPASWGVGVSCHLGHGPHGCLSGWNRSPNSGGRFVPIRINREVILRQREAGHAGPAGRKVV